MNFSNFQVIFYTAEGCSSSILEFGSQQYVYISELLFQFSLGKTVMTHIELKGSYRIFSWKPLVIILTISYVSSYFVRRICYDWMIWQLIFFSNFLLLLGHWVFPYFYELLSLWVFPCFDELLTFSLLRLSVSSFPWTPNVKLSTEVYHVYWSL